MQEAIKIRSKKHPDVVLHTIPGHFVTPNSHVNYFLDMTTLKSRLSEASAAARALGEHISPTTIVDTIVCIEGCEIIGALLAEELTKAGVYSMNSHKTIYIVTPEYVNSGQLIIRENMLPMIIRFRTLPPPAKLLLRRAVRLLITELKSAASAPFSAPPTVSWVFRSTHFLQLRTFPITGPMSLKAAPCAKRMRPLTPLQTDLVIPRYRKRNI